MLIYSHSSPVPGLCQSGRWMALQEGHHTRRLRVQASLPRRPKFKQPSDANLGSYYTRAKILRSPSGVP